MFDEQTKYTLGNQDVDTSFLTLEMTWRGIEVPEVKDQVGMHPTKTFCEIVKGTTINFYVPKDEFKKFSDICAQKIIEDESFRVLLKKNTINSAKDIRDYAIKYIDQVDSLNYNELAEIIIQMTELQKKCVIYGTVVAFADIFGQISDKVMEVINSRENLKHPKHLYSNILGNPEEKSLTEKAYEEIKASQDDEALLKKYFWLDQGYIGRGLIKNQLEEIRERHVEKVQLDRNELLAELKLSDEEKKYFEISKFLIEVKSLRADSCQFIQVVVNKIVDRIAKEKNIEAKYLEAMYAEEFSEFLIENKMPENIKERWEHSATVFSSTADYTFIFGKEIDEFLQKKLYKEEIEDKSILKGQIAQPGFIKGKAKLVFGPQHLEKVNEGDILVAKATSPQLLPAMKKASAFVTDLGGITSHAAIVSRELNKPCIVGTKHATELIMDGDEVEVDAEKGIVKIIK